MAYAPLQLTVHRFMLWFTLLHQSLKGKETDDTLLFFMVGGEIRVVVFLGGV